jgi:hypothetical protein
MTLMQSLMGLNEDWEFINTLHGAFTFAGPQIRTVAAWSPHIQLCYVVPGNCGAGLAQAV